MTRMVLEISELNYSYGKQVILRDISLQIEEGKIACLLGPSGCGKTTLLRCIAGFESIESGHIILNQQIVSSRTFYAPPEKRRVGVVFQDYALFPHMTVEKNIEFGIQQLPKAKRQEKVQSLMNSIELEHVKDRYPSELSGGQQQRVALARALAPGPDLLLLDEPFAHLDPNLRDKMKNELKQLLRHFGVTALIVTHDQSEAFDMADEVAVMVDGHIAQWGSAYELYHRPANRVVAEFLGTSAFLPVVVNEYGNLQTELGIIEVNSKFCELQNKKLTLILRPDDIVHDDEGKLKARVKGVVFRGTYRLYYLILPSGLEIHSLTSSHHELHEIGSLIGIRLDIEHAVISYDDRVIIEEKQGSETIKFA